MSPGDNSDFVDDCATGRFEQVQQALTEKKPDLKVPQDKIDQGLVEASWGGNTQIIGLLLSNGARITTLALQGMVRSQNPQIFKEFLDHGWDPDTQFAWDDPVLRLCANLECARLILENGGDPNIVGESGFSALATATADEKVDMLDLLISYGATVKPELLYDALRPGIPASETMTKYLLGKGIDVNTPSPRWGTPLHFAIAQKRVDKVKLLLDAGADASAKPPALRTSQYPNMTPLEAAKKEGDMEICEVVAQAESRAAIPKEGSKVGRGHASSADAS